MKKVISQDFKNFNRKNLVFVLFVHPFRVKEFVEYYSALLRVKEYVSSVPLKSNIAGH